MKKVRTTPIRSTEITIGDILNSAGHFPEEDGLTIYVESAKVIEIRPEAILAEIVFAEPFLDEITQIVLQEATPLGTIITLNKFNPSDHNENIFGKIID